MNFEDWEGLMQGEENHGHKRESGLWHDLNSTAGDVIEQGYEYVVQLPIHGLRSTYQHVGCRCPSCTRANREYVRALRNRAVRPSDDS